MGPMSLVGHDLAQRRLYAPLPEVRLPLERYYYGLSPAAGPEAALLVRWLLEAGQPTLASNTRR